MNQSPSAPRRASRWGEAERIRERESLAQLAELDADDPRRAGVRDDLVTMHLPLVRHLARRYQDRGESIDDLVQVGTVGLIKAVDRFDLARGVEFSTFATPTILGEIKRHFRDTTWAVRVPRRLQELQAQVTSVSDELTRTLHRSPTVRELAESIGVTQDEILQALEARHAYNASSLEAGSDDESEGSSPIAGRFGTVDPEFEQVEYRESLRPSLNRLPERERRIILLRFFHNMSQTEIAEEMGMSQMHVSRLLARALEQLRESMTDR